MHWIFVVTIIIAIVAFVHSRNMAVEPAKESIKGIIALSFCIVMPLLFFIDSTFIDSGSFSKDSGSYSKKRVGAVCNDGWISTATGQGACSHHDGVDYWLYE